MEKEGWKSSKVARNYAQIVDVAIPERRQILSIIAGLATSFVPDSPRVLDIGCGFGDVTNEILLLKPDASVCMVDFSDEMLRMSSERFISNKNVKVIKTSK